MIFEHSAAFWAVWISLFVLGFLAGGCVSSRSRARELELREKPRDSQR